MRVDAESANALDQLASVMCHDLEEPLRAAAHFASRLRSHVEAGSGGEARECLGQVEESLQRMQELVHSLLSYARLGAEPLQRARVDSREVLARAIGRLELAIRESAAHVTYDRLPTVRAAALPLGQVFQNLIANAIKFRRGRPVIHVSARRADREWIFSVRDNGIGMDPSQASDAFQIFARLSPGEGPSGSGVGLAICARVIERHGGRIWLDSHPGQGTTVSFSIPL
jgi:signal transduction histidine kinase